jgi:hypothetical protein
MKIRLTRVVIAVNKERDDLTGTTVYSCPVGKESGEPTVRVIGISPDLKHACAFRLFGARALKVAAAEIENRLARRSIVLDIECEDVGKKETRDSYTDKETGRVVEAKDSDYQGKPVYELVGVTGLNKVGYVPYQDNADTSAINL